MEYFAKQLINGLALGSIYALVAVGYNMVYGILQLINFAHGDIYMFGSFISLSLSRIKIPFAIGGPLAALAGGLTALVVERVAYRPVRGANRIVPMISAVGAALVIRNVALLVWGPETFSHPKVIPANPISIGPFTFNTLQLVILVLATALMGLFMLLVRSTKLGKATRAVSQDIPTARLMGIEANRIIQLVYFAGGFLGVAGGILFSMYYAIWIGMGFLGTMKAWTAVVLGGIGSLKGAFVGGMLLGLAEAFISGYISSAYRDAISFGILMLVLLVRPTGLFGQQLAQRA